MKNSNKKSQPKPIDETTEIDLTTEDITETSQTEDDKKDYENPVKNPKPKKIVRYGKSDSPGYGHRK